MARDGADRKSLWPSPRLRRLLEWTDPMECTCQADEEQRTRLH